MRISTQQAIEQLKAGHVVALPTETVYGLAASLTHLAAIQKIFILKGRPLANPLIIHISSPQEVLQYARDLPPLFEKLAEAFWPGPLTLIVPIKADCISSLVCANLDTAGFRMPDHPLTLQILQEAGPLVMPSANLSGKPSATCLEHVERDFGNEFPVMDGGPCQKGVESTILFYKEPRWIIVRQGAFPPEIFEGVLGYVPEVFKNVKVGQPLCPGQAFRHYAPQAQLILGEPSRLQEITVILGFKERTYPPGKKVFELGSLTNPASVAENLYGVLRQLDLEEIHIAWVDMDFPREGLWNTILERLLKAGE